MMLKDTSQLASILRGMAKTRLALASLELGEARHRFIRLLMLGLFAVISGFLCLITLTIFLGVFLQRFFLLENVLLGLMLYPTSTILCYSIQILRMHFNQMQTILY